MADRVVVVGAGIVGVGAALALQARGLAVTIIDSQQPGRGCSFGNAGVITPSAFPLTRSAPLSALPRLFASRSSPVALEWSGLTALAPWAWHYARATAPGRVERDTETMHRLAADGLGSYRMLLGAALTGVQERGYLVLHSTAKEGDAALRSDATRVALGVRSRCVSPKELVALEPSLAGAGPGATLIDEAAHVADPFAFVSRAFETFMRRGGAYEPDRIQRIEPQREGVVLYGERTAHVCAKVVLAAGAASNALLRPLGAAVPLIAERGYHAELDGMAFRVTRPVAIPALGAVLSPTDDGIRFVGLSHFGRPGMRPRPVLMQRALRRLNQRLPAARPTDAPVWSGERPATPDSLPIVGSTPGMTQVFICTGHGHLGLTLAAVTGRIVADLVCGIATPLAGRLSPQRFASRYRSS